MSAKKELGQHWLRDETSLEAMIETARLDSNDTVLEIGPGLGTLTEKLIAHAARVIAVELDENLADNLSKQISDEKFEIISQDILSFDLTLLPSDYVVIANIPYYLTSNLIRVLSESSNPPKSATLLVQKEVAHRLAAGPGQMSILSVTAQMYFEPTLGRVVKAELFEPPPKIDSQIIHLQRRPLPLFQSSDPKVLFRLVKAGFSNRRKTLLNSLSAGLHITKQEAEEILMTAKINPQSRPQELRLEDWLRLAALID